MATTSGLINTVTVSRDTMITDALEDMSVLLDGAAPNANDLTKGARKLNFLIKKWAIKGLLLWCRDTIPIPLLVNKFVYTIGPGGDVNTYRPLRALEGSFVRDTCAPGCPVDIPLNLLSRLDYERMGQKCTKGTPNSFYYDPQMAPSPFSAYDAALSKGVLYIWTAPSDSTKTIYLEVQRPIQDMTVGSQTFDLPLEWYETLSKNLAASLCNAYEVPREKRIEIKQEAKDALTELADWGAQEQAPMRFQPDYRWSNMQGYGR
jgi:hypothetical protein